MLKKIVIFLILVTWPISLFVNNTFMDFLNYIFPFLNPKFAIFPILFVLIYYQFKKPKLILLSLLVLVIFIKPFFGQTIFIKDYEAGQKILQEQKLYNSVFLARLFQNKARIPLDKFTNNLFALTDPGNYFFGFAPRQITIDNQNLKKFPFLSLPFLLLGLYSIKKLKYYKLILAFTVAAIINLSLLTNFDRNDFVLWLPLSIFIIYGLNVFHKHFKYAKYFEFIFITFASLEIIRIFLI